MLKEHEIPKNKHQDPAQLASGSGSNVQQQPPIPAHSNDKFPGSGNTLGSSNNQTPAATSSSASNTNTLSNSAISDDKINKLMELGVTREEAIQALKSTNGNLEFASSLLF